MPQLGEIARWLDGDLTGPEDKEIRGVAPIHEAGPDQITFADGPKYLKLAAATNAGAVIVARDAPELPVPTIRVASPRLAWVEVLERFKPPVDHEPGIHESAAIGEGVTIGKGVSIGPFCVIGDGVSIGDGTRIAAGVYVGRETKIGRGCVVEPNVTLYERVLVGNNVIIHAGAVIGSDGFGYVRAGGKQKKVPHLGTVVIEDDVELGALVAIDRGVAGPTIVGRGSKIGNMVQIAHNVRIGEDNVIVGFAGIAGSAIIGNRVTIAGQVGVMGHVEVGDDTVIAARAVITKNTPPRSFVSGFPARPHMENMRILASTQRLPETESEVRELKQRVKLLEEQLRRLEEELPARGGAP